MPRPHGPNPRHYSPSNGRVGNLLPAGTLAHISLPSHILHDPSRVWTGLRGAPLCPKELSCRPAHVKTGEPSPTTTGPLASPANKAPLSRRSHSAQPQEPALFSRRLREPEPCPPGFRTDRDTTFPLSRRCCLGRGGGTRGAREPVKGPRRLQVPVCALRPRTRGRLRSVHTCALVGLRVIGTGPLPAPQQAAPGPRKQAAIPPASGDLSTKPL